MKKTALLAVALLGLAPAAWSQGEAVIDGVAAVVGKNIVKYSDIERSYALMRLRSSAETEENSRCAILENMIISQLMVHKGEVDSVEVNDETVNQYLQYYLDNDLQQYGSKEALREATGFAYDELKEQYERMIRVSLLTRSVEYQLTEEVSVTPGQVADFFQSLAADSLPTIPERVELSEIVIQPRITEAERDRVRTELAALRERVLKGEKFSMLATLYSQDPGSARNGGELGFFGRGKMVGEFEAAAFALKPGEVSPIIETQYGFHIIQLIERRGNTVNVRHILMTPQVSADDLLRARMVLDSIATEIREGRLAFEEAARRFSTASNAKQGGTAINPSDGTTRFDKAALDEHYYAVGVGGMEVGQVSNASAMKTDDNKDAYRIVRLNRRLPAHKANMDDDYDIIYNAALNDAKQRKLRDWALKQSGITYIHLSDEYKNCAFQNIKVNND